MVQYGCLCGCAVDAVDHSQNSGLAAAAFTVVIEHRSLISAELERKLAKAHHQAERVLFQTGNVVLHDDLFPLLYVALLSELFNDMLELIVDLDKVHTVLGIAPVTDQDFCVVVSPAHLVIDLIRRDSSLQAANVPKHIVHHLIFG